MNCFRTVHRRLLAAAACCVMAAGCHRDPSNRIQGYIEGEFVYVSSPSAGKLETLSVVRGAQVHSNDLLFVLESTPEKAGREEAERRLAQARATLEDVKKGKRPSEIEALEAQLGRSRAALQFSEKELVRQEQLRVNSGATAEEEVDRARSRRDQDRHAVAQAEAELATARLSARADQVAAAEANVRALAAALERAEWNLGQTSQRAPQTGIVFDTLYREGEWVAANRPVVMLLPPANVKLRAFVPETWLGSIHAGDRLNVSIDGSGAAVAAKVSFISPRAEFTPPVIYSRENRSKFVYLLEAVFDPATAERLHPGQPVDVEFTTVPSTTR